MTSIKTEREQTRRGVRRHSGRGAFYVKYLADFWGKVKGFG
jgi:hypothetical protein